MSTGPGSYFQEENALVSSNRIKLPQPITKVKRRDQIKTSASTVTGPGSYNPNFEYIKTKPHSIAMTKSRRMDIEKKEESAIISFINEIKQQKLDYLLKSNDEPKVIEKKERESTPRRPKIVEEQSPGPGYYDVNITSSGVAKGIAFPKAKKFESTLLHHGKMIYQSSNMDDSVTEEGMDKSKPSWKYYKFKKEKKKCESFLSAIPRDCMKKIEKKSYPGPGAYTVATEEKGASTRNAARIFVSSIWIYLH